MRYLQKQSLDRRAWKMIHVKKILEKKDMAPCPRVVHYTNQEKMLTFVYKLNIQTELTVMIYRGIFYCTCSPQKVAPSHPILLILIQE